MSRRRKPTAKSSSKKRKNELKPRAHFEHGAFWRNMRLLICSARRTERTSHFADRGSAAITKKQKKHLLSQVLCGCPTGTEGEARPVGEAASRPWRRRRLYASEQRSGKTLTPRGHFQFKAELGKKRKSTYSHRCSVVAQRGFEPRQTESESVVLPLHNSAILNFLRPQRIV